MRKVKAVYVEPADYFPKEIRKELSSTNSELSGIEHQIYNSY